MKKEDTTELKFREVLLELKTKIISYEDYYIEKIEQWLNFIKQEDDDEIMRHLVAIRHILQHNIKLSTQRDLSKYE